MLNLELPDCLSLCYFLALLHASPRTARLPFPLLHPSFLRLFGCTVQRFLNLALGTFSHALVTLPLSPPSARFQDTLTRAAGSRMVQVLRVTPPTLLDAIHKARTT